MKSEALADKDKMIKLQKQLLEQKDVQLKWPQTAVKTTVQNIV